MSMIKRICTYITIVILLISMTTLSNRLIEVMNERQISQEKLAEKSGVSQATICKLKTGRSFGSRKMSQIALALGVNTDWLSLGNGSKYPGQTNEATNQQPPIIQPCLINDDQWQLLPPQVRALIEVILNKSTSGSLTLSRIKLLLNMVDELANDA